MSFSPKILAAAVAVGAVVAGGVWYVVKPSPAEPPTIQSERVLPPIEPEVVATPVIEPIVESIAEPLVEAVPEQPAEPLPEPEDPLPSMAESDAALKVEFEQWTQGTRILSILTPEELVRKTVLWTENARQGKLSRKYPPIEPPKSAFKVSKNGEVMTLDSAGYDRFDGYIDLLEAIDSEQLVSLYRHYYPLLQQGYDELGIGGSFNAALLEALRSVEQAPDLPERAQLIRPSVMYKYKDPDLEALPETYKLLMRMGPENTDRLKQILRQFRQALQST